MAVFNQSPYVMNRPMARKDAQSNVIPASFGDMAFRGSYSGTNLQYKGLGRPGSSESDAVWQIALLAYDGSNNITSITWPQDADGNASSEYAFSWTDRATYTYS